MERAEAEQLADLILIQLRQHVLLKRELEWYRREEPVVFRQIKEELCQLLMNRLP